MATVASETFTSTSAPIQYAAVTAFQQNSEIDTYVEKCRTILAALAEAVMARLKTTQVWALSPQGGFYVFPDFGEYRDLLKKHSVTTSIDLCEQLLQDTGVAILPGADFGRARHELTARIAFVDFNGDAALKNYSEGHPVTDEFLEKYCGRTLKAVDLIVEWLAKL